MVLLKVYGSLRNVLKLKEHSICNCHSFKQLLSYLDNNFKSLYNYLVKNSEAPFFISVNNRPIVSKEELYNLVLKDNDIVVIAPVISGSGDNWGSVASIIIGIILIIVGFYYPGTWYGVFALAMGTSMTMSGVSQLLFKPEEIEPSTYDTADKSKANYSFSGAVNLTSQGNAVPVGYGRLLVGSQVIGAGLFAVSL